MVRGAAPGTPAPPGSSAECTPPLDDAERQAAYHRLVFPYLYDWERAWAEALDMVGDDDAAERLGLDQLGHFGPRGTALVAERLVNAGDGALGRCLELGSGFGGALRHMRRLLAARGIHPVMVGVELVYDHVAQAARIGEAADDTTSLSIVADVHRLPLAEASVDAVFATGSASHFRSMAGVLAECRRVLRRGGVLVISDEVGLRPDGAPAAGAAFAHHHPPDVFRSAPASVRRSEVEAAGLRLEAFEPLGDWALPLLRQRAQMLRLLEHCARPLFGSDSYERMIGTLDAAADEYEAGTIEPALIVARQPCA